MSVNNVIPNFANQTLAKVMRGESLTVPTSVNAPSPAGLSSGLSPSTVFDGLRRTVGGAIYAAMSDAAGPTSADFQYPLNPGDVVACSNAAPMVVTVNGVTVFSLANTSVAGVLLYYS